MIAARRPMHRCDAAPRKGRSDLRARSGAAAAATRTHNTTRGWTTAAPAVTRLAGSSIAPTAAILQRRGAWTPETRLGESARHSRRAVHGSCGVRGRWRMSRRLPPPSNTRQYSNQIGDMRRHPSLPPAPARPPSPQRARRTGPVPMPSAMGGASPGGTHSLSGKDAGTRSLLVLSSNSEVRCRVHRTFLPNGRCWYSGSSRQLLCGFVCAANSRAVTANSPTNETNAGGRPRLGASRWARLVFSSQACSGTKSPTAPHAPSPAWKWK